MGAAAYLGPPSPLPWAVRAAGAAALALGAGAFGPRAIRAFLRARTTGVYARTRNPMSVALALLLAARAAWLGRWAPALGPIAFVLYITRFQIAPEERALTARFGHEYVRYRSTVRRWL